MANAWFETVAEAQRRAKKRLPGSVYGALVAGSEKGVSLDDNLAAFGELGFAPHVAGLSDEAGAGHDGDGPAHLDAGADLADRRAGRRPRRRGGRGPRRRQPRHRDGSQLVRQQAHRGGRRGQPADLLPDVLVRHPRPAPAAHGAGPGRRRRRPHRHARLVVLERARLGQPVDPREDRPQDGDAVRARGAPPPALAGGVRQDRAGSPTSPCRTWPSPASPPRPSSAPTTSGCRPRCPTWDDVAWLCSEWGGQFMLKGIGRVDDAKRAVDAGFTAISVSNHGGNNLDSTPAPIRVAPGRRRGGRRPDRRGARRRHPPGQRRREGGRPRRQGRHDRPGLPVGPRRQRPGRRGERARHPPRRHRLGAARHRPQRHPRPEPDDLIIPAGFTRARGLSD